jgi:hypothetical protein
LYSGAYRLCVGEFSTLSPAIDLQNMLRKNSYPQATVLAFKNDVLSLDPELLKQQPGAVQTTATEQKKVAEVAAVTAVTAQAATTTIPPKEKVQPEVKKTEQVKTTAPVATTAAPAASGNKDVVVYRVQIATTSTPKGSYKITMAGKAYDTFEYQYAGAYRTCVGAFNVLSGASEFQKTCRASGYPQAFVVAFKNNVRSTDPALFK